MSDALRVIDHPLIATLGWTLTHFVWQGAVLGLFAFFILRVIRPIQASTRYLVGVCTLAAMLLAPIATFISTAGQTASSRRMWGESSPPAGVSNAGLVTGAIVANVEGNPAAIRALIPPGGGSTRANAAPIAPEWLPLVTAAWMIGVTVLSLRMLGGWLMAQTLARRRIRAVAREIEAAARDTARRLRLRREFAVLESAAVTVPTLVGWLKPVVLLPAAALTGLTPHQLQAVIAHELAHIRRHDYLVNLLQSFVETLLFYHPGVWWVSAEIRAEREHCCDDLAVEACGDRLVYVSALAELTSMERRAFALAATDGSLLARVRRILGRATDTRRELPPSWGILVLLVLLGGGAGTYEMSADAADVAQIARAAASSRLVTDPPTELEGAAPQPRVWSPFTVDPVPPTRPSSPAPPAPAPVAVSQPVVPATPAMVPHAPAVAPVAAPPAPATPITPVAAPAVPALAPLPPSAVPAAPLPPNGPMTEVSAAPEMTSSGRSQGNVVWTNDNERLAVKWTGRFRLADDERDIAWVEQGALVTIANGWVFTDRVELRGLANGQIERTYYRSGLKRDFDGEAREFLTTSIQRMIRAGMFASERVARMLQQGGPDAVLAEVDRLQTDSSYVKRTYYAALLNQADPSASQLSRLIERVTTISSDYEKRTLLELLLEESAVTDEQRVLIARASARMSSDYEQRRVLCKILSPSTPSPTVISAVLDALGAVSSAHERATVLLDIARKGGVTAENSEQFMKAVTATSSAHEQRRVLTAITARPVLAQAVALDSVKAVVAISSSHEKAQVLLQLIAHGGVSEKTAASFFNAVDGITSAYEKYQVLAALVAREKLPEDIIAAIIRSAKGVARNYDRSRLLVDLVKAHAIVGNNRTLFLDAADTITSSHEQNQVLAALVRAERR